MAIANASYEIIFCDVGTNGRISDGGVIKNTLFYNCLINGKLHLPKEKLLKNSRTVLPYVFVGDDAFKARRIIENVFGILVQRFQVFQSVINLKISSVEVVVLGACILHNYLRMKSNNYIPNDVAVSENRKFDAEPSPGGNINTDESRLTDLQYSPSRNCSMLAKEIRERFIKYFMEEGQLDWQWKIIRSEGTLM